MANAKFYDKDKVDTLLAAKRDKTDNACHQTTSGFSPWFATPPSGFTFGDAQPTFDSTSNTWKWNVQGTGVDVDAESGASTTSAVSATFSFVDSSSGTAVTHTFTATRFAATEATSGENYVTKSYVSSQFSSGNTYLMGVVRYPVNAVTASNPVADRAINVISGVAMTVPTGFTDLLFRFTVASGDTPSLTLPAEIVDDYGDDLPSEAGEYLLTCTKINTDEAFIKVVELEAR